MSIILALRVDPGTPIRRGRDHYWTLIRNLTAFDRDALFDATFILERSQDVDLSSIRRDLTTLERAGFLARVQAGGVTMWRVVQRPTRLPSLSADGRVVETGQGAMWNAIRALGSFTHAEVALAASTEELPISPIAAKSYVLRLAGVGYLKVERTATSKRQARWRLRPSMNTGPLPPRILRTKLVFDPNRNEVVGLSDAEEVSP
mgnify:CR=1 FL=1|jgi:hypothetical protein